MASNFTPRVSVSKPEKQYLASNVFCNSHRFYRSMFMFLFIGDVKEDSVEFCPLTEPICALAQLISRAL